MVGPGRHERPPFFQRVGAPKACRMSERRLRVSHSRMASARAHTECGGLAPLLFARREGSGFARQHRFRAGAFQALGPNAPPSKCKIRAPARRALPARAISRGSQGYRHRPSRCDGRAPALRAWAADGRRRPSPATRSWSPSLSSFSSRASKSKRPRPLFDCFRSREFSRQQMVE